LGHTEVSIKLWRATWKMSARVNTVAIVCASVVFMAVSASLTNQHVLVCACACALACRRQRPRHDMSTLALRFVRMRRVLHTRQAMPQERGVGEGASRPSGMSSAKTIHIIVPAAQPSPMGSRKVNHSTKR